MRVLHVINTLGAGGAERSLAEMLPLFARAGVESRVACLAHASEGVHERVEASGIRVDVLGPGRAESLLRLRRLVRTWNPDVVHTTIYDADVLGRVAAARTPARVLTSLVSPTYDGVRLADREISPIKYRAAKALDEVTARHLTDHFHAVSQAVKHSAIHHLGIAPERITVIERGRDPARLGEPSWARRTRVRRSLGLTDDVDVLVHVGRQEPAKDLLTMLRAMQQLTARSDSPVLLQAGRSGKATSAIRAMVEREGLGRVVRFLGHREDVGDLLSAADLLVLCSIYEGMPGSILEAMAMRVPIVSTDLPALHEILQPGTDALVVPPRSPSALAQAIEHLLDDRDAADEMASRAQQIFFDRFTLERSADRMVELYRTVAEQERTDVRHRRIRR